MKSFKNLWAVKKATACVYSYADQMKSKTRASQMVLTSLKRRRRGLSIIALACAVAALFYHAGHRHGHRHEAASNAGSKTINEEFAGLHHKRWIGRRSGQYVR